MAELHLDLTEEELETLQLAAFTIPGTAGAKLRQAIAAELDDGASQPSDRSGSEVANG